MLRFLYVFLRFFAQKVKRSCFNFPPSHQYQNARLNALAYYGKAWITTQKKFCSFDTWSLAQRSPPRWGWGRSGKPSSFCTCSSHGEVRLPWNFIITLMFIGGTTSSTTTPTLTASNITIVSIIYYTATLSRTYFNIIISAIRRQRPCPSE